MRPFKISLRHKNAIGYFEDFCIDIDNKAIKKKYFTSISKIV